MLGQARHLMPPHINPTDVTFLLTDCSKPVFYPGGPFDIVFGAWLLNYASDREGLVDICRNIALNLRDSGHFVTVTVPPPPTADDPRASVEAEARVRSLAEGGSWGLVYRYVEDVEDGIFFQVHGETGVGDADFEC